MATILTISHAADPHADAVGWALQQRGHNMLLWNFAEFPGSQVASVNLSADDVAVAFPASGRRCDPPASAPIDVVWRRRPVKPVPSEELPEADQAVSIRESQVLCDASVMLVASAARWVNPEAAARAADLKPLQLEKALKAGLKIPETLCSNDPDAVRRFAEKHGGRIIHKSSFPVGWSGQGKRYRAETALMSEALLANDFAIAAAPGIYQPYVEKNHELRVTIMGAECLAAKLTLPSGLPLDARNAHGLATVVEVELPANLRQACLRLMEDLGLVFGCIDLIATEDETILFLEINQMGQFLWVEDRNPEIPMLSVFTDFIASGRPDFRRGGPKDEVSMNAYRRSVRHQQLKTRAAALTRRTLSNVVLWDLPEPE